MLPIWTGLKFCRLVKNQPLFHTAEIIQYLKAMENCNINLDECPVLPQCRILSCVKSHPLGDILEK